MTLNSESIAKAIRALSDADALLVTAGAGMGVDSGLPDFRGAEGFWSAYPALRHEGLDFFDIASPATFRRDPRLAWGFYGHRLAMYRSTAPHEGFGILLKWANAMSNGCRVFTSNVDGQFQKAGFAVDQMAECHGSIHFLQCSNNCTDKTWSANSFYPVVDSDRCRLTNDLPTCPNCGSLVRPNILMFDDGEWIGRQYQRQRDALDEWLTKARNVVVVELGAGTGVPTVRYFSERTGTSLIRINLREAHSRRADAICLEGGAFETLRVLDDHR